MWFVDVTCGVLYICEPCEPASHGVSHASHASYASHSQNVKNFYLQDKESHINHLRKEIIALMRIWSRRMTCLRDWDNQIDQARKRGTCLGWAKNCREVGRGRATRGRGVGHLTPYYLFFALSHIFRPIVFVPFPIIWKRKGNGCYAAYIVKITRFTHHSWC